MRIATSVRQAMDLKIGVVALESSVISQGLPYPNNLEIALGMEKEIRDEKAVPATLAIMDGSVTVGCDLDEIKRLATEKGVIKAGSRDIGAAITHKKNAALTVSASLKVAFKAGIRVFSTGGIGGVHYFGDDFAPDISSDLLELSRNPVVVVCAGAKNILNLGATLEVLESLAIPVFGFQVNEFPAFYLRSSGFKISEIQSVKDVVSVSLNHWTYSNSAVLVCLPVNNEFALEQAVWDSAFNDAITKARENKISGPATTPFLLREVGAYTNGATIVANEKILLANAKLGAQIAVEFSKMYPDV